MGNVTTQFLTNRSVWNSLSEEAQQSLFELIATDEFPEEADDVLVGSRPQSCDSKTKHYRKIEAIEDNKVEFCLFWEKA